MSVFARSDLAAVSISVAHGGCGHTHSRPTNGGNPAAVWELTCEPCSDHLRHDPSWASTAVEVPETWDETKARENFEKRGAKDKDAVLTLALARLAGIETAELPESLTRMISGVPVHIPGQMECPSGHGNPAGMKFCGQCGAPMHGQVPAAAIAQKAAEPEVQPGRQRRLRDARLDELQALARERLLDSEGNRAELIARLSAAGVTSNDLSRLPVAA